MEGEHTGPEEAVHRAVETAQCWWEERRAAAGSRSWDGQNLWNDCIWVEKRVILRLILRSLALVPVHWGRTRGEMTGDWMESYFLRRGHVMRNPESYLSVLLTLIVPQFLVFYRRNSGDWG